MMKQLKCSLYPEGALIKEGFSLFEGRGFGVVNRDGLFLFPEEVVFLFEKGKILADGNVDPRVYFSKKNKGFVKRYIVYRDLRERGFIPKSGAKYGADFRVYEKGAKLSEKIHSKYLVWVLDQDAKVDLKTLIGINRIAHSVKKRLILAMVDKDQSTTYLQSTRVLL